MRLILIALAVLMAVALAGNRGDLPFAKDMFYTGDTLHVTTAEQGWAIGAYSGAYWLRLTNNTANTYTLRFSTDGADTVLLTCGTFSSFPIPGSIPILMVPLDSIFIDGSGSFTLEIEWLEVR